TGGCRYRDDRLSPKRDPTATIDVPRRRNQLPHHHRLPHHNPGLPGRGDLDDLRTTLIHRHQFGHVQRSTGLPVRLLPTVVVVLVLRSARNNELHTVGLDFQLHLAVPPDVGAGRATRTP